MRFCTKAPWPDVISTKDSLKQLPLLSQFFDVQPVAQLIDSSEGTEFIVQTLGTVLASLLPIGFSQFVGQTVIREGSRRAQLRLQVIAKINESLSNRFSPDVVQLLQEAIRKEASKIKKQIKQAGSDKNITPILPSKPKKVSPGQLLAIRKEASKIKKQIKQAHSDITHILLSRLAIFVGMDDISSFDMVEINPFSISWSDTKTNAKKTKHEKHLAKIAENETHSRSLLENVVIAGPN